MVNLYRHPTVAVPFQVSMATKIVAGGDLHECLRGLGFVLSFEWNPIWRLFLLFATITLWAWVVHSIVRIDDLKREIRFLRRFGRGIQSEAENPFCNGLRRD